MLTDITDLLLLPQKVAAAKLGITESVLSKKYKQATNRKWPYRYLKKMDRDIENAKTQEEKEKLKKIREEILSPVSINIKRIPYDTDTELIIEIEKN